MTTLQMQITSNLQASATEDPMELTSDMDRRLGGDDDIDIDLDLTADDYQYEEDEYMGDDVDVFTDLAPTNEQPMQEGNDDEMADDNYVEGSVYDEDLEDAEDPAIYPASEDPVVDAHLGNPSHVSQESLDNQQQISPNDGQGPDYRQQRSTSEENPSVEPARLLDTQNELDSHDTAGLVAQAISQELTQEHGDETTEWYEQRHQGISQELAQQHEVEATRYDDESHQGLSQESRQVYEDQTSRTEHESHQSISQEPQEEYDDDSRRQEPSGHEYSTDLYRDNAPHAPEAIPEKSNYGEEVEAPPKEVTPTPENDKGDQSEEYQDGPDGPPSIKSNHVHPVVVIYQDNEISLFPPVNQDEEHSNTYFLQDEQVAGESIGHLFEALRSILGESISDQEELMLDMNDLDLHISESTVEASTTTLLQIIDVYNHLQHYDGVEDVPPLYMNLIAKTSFSQRFEFLLNAIVEGKGFSQLRSSEAADEIQHPGFDESAVHDVGDTSQQDGVLRNTKTEVAEHKELREPGATPDNIDNRNKLPASTERSHIAEATTQGLAPPDGVNTIGKDIASVEVYSENKAPQKEVNTKEGENEIKEPQEEVDIKEENQIKEYQEAENKEEKNTEVIQTNEDSENTAVPSASRSAVAPKPDDATLDEEDSIEYEDEEDLAHGNSSGSSTVQGDIFDANADHDRAEPEESIAGGSVKDPENDPDAIGTAVEPENFDEFSFEEEGAVFGDSENVEGGKAGLFDPNDNPITPLPAQANLNSPTLAKVDGKFQVDEDEITDEDEDDVEAPEEAANTQPNVASSPGSLKRARSLHEDHDDPEDDSQGVKRVRSG